MKSIQIHSVDGREVSVSRSKLRKYSPRIQFMLKPYSNIVSITLYLPYAYESIKIIDEFMKKQFPKFYSLKHAMDVYRISRTLCMRLLINYCRTHLAQPIHIPHICAIYELACESTDYTLQYFCWTMFNDHWDKVFFQSKIALDCGEIVIRRLVSRPMYRNLDVVTIFKIVYEWARRRVNSNTSLRQVMIPFLPNIRFLTMDDEFLKGYIYPKQFLTEEEVNAIQHYKATSDNSMIPDSICRTDVSRNNEKSTSWFVYCNRSSSILGKEMNMENKFHFISEIYVVEDCFITGIELPIFHSRKVEIGIKVMNFFESGIWKIDKEQKAICEPNGKIILNRVFYVQKSSIVLVIAKINDNDIPGSNIRIRNFAIRYILDEGMTIRTGETVPLSKDIEYLYCNVKLYF
ncbi:uncharacterized protein LOC111622022 isoform X1 [Centruroides sculpturatus]|uniref:uncharacterized protein LOC111622022 isoform X1 n=1 Tax=Centruroides sculpturatus TaxID=218467 RepID=UPI000C6EF675|nr:uncharacterized protein LOC111622022 isoform X1 [Centruroides sculpturatus]